MDLATAITKKLNEDSTNANLVNEVSNRLAANLAVYMQEKLPTTDGVKLFSKAQDSVSDIVNFYRSGGHIAKMSEPVLGRFLAAAEPQILDALTDKFSKAFVIVQQKRHERVEAQNLVSLIR
jgi:hypothetical protein